MPDLVPAQLTPDEQAEFDKAAPAPVTQPSVLQSLSAPELAELAVKDKDNFDLVNEFRNSQDLWKDPSVVQKVADAHNLIRQRGFQLSDLPGPAKIAGQVYDVGRGLVKQGWNYANAAVNAAMGVVAPSGVEDELTKDAQQRVAENFAGTEQAVTGLGNMAEKGVKKIVSKLPGTKTPADLSPEERVKDLWDAVGQGETEQDISKGHGAFMNAVGGNVISDLEKEGKGVRPEEVAKLAPGDPFSFWAFGKAMGGAGKAISSATPEVVGDIASNVGKKISDNVTKVGGKAIQAAGTALGATGKGIEVTGKVLKTAGPVIEAGKAILGGDPSKAVTGVGDYYGGSALKFIGERAQKFVPAVKQFGKEVGGDTPMVSPYAQLTKDVIESAPGAVANVAKGAVADIGTAAVSSESPKDTEGVGLGTAIGALHGAGRTAMHAVSGQIIAPRAWGSQNPVASSGNFPKFDAMHSQAIQDAAPGVRERLNAIRQFAKGTAPNTDVFLAPDEASLQSVLEASGMPSEQAAQTAQQDGFFMANLPDKNGTPRRVIVAKNIESAPHEAYHAIQDVLGETANRQIDEIVKRNYADRWDTEGARYASRLDNSLDPANWRDTVLDFSGVGRSEAVDKLYQQVSNETRNATNAEPDPAFVKDRVTGEWNKRLEAAKANNPSASPEALQAQVWRDILTPDEQKAAADRYLARELAAENFDMVFKHGPEGKSLPEQLARVVARLSLAMGSEPLADRQSEIGKITPSSEVADVVRKSIPVEPAKPSVAPKTAPAPAASLPKTDEDRAASAKEAKDLADAAPDSPLPGKTSSPKEILGTVAEAIAQQSGVKINYHSAPGEPAAATSSNREARRQVIEAFRDMPKSVRPLFEKSFFPERVVKTGKSYQVMGWSPEVFAANAHKLAQVLADVNPKLSPYEIDPDFHTFTDAGWKALYEDVQRFVKNQMAGSTGAGESLVVPKSVTDKGAFAPQIKPGAEPLDQNRADFINLLFNFRLPDTARIQKGRLPLNVVGQEVSEATKPGRTAIPVRPRGQFVGKEADALGIAGRDIKEVNPLRQQIEAAAAAKGKAMPSMVESIQRLNLDNINDVQLAPEQPQFRGNTLTLTAGFQPPSEEARAKGKEFIDSAAIKLGGKVYKGQWHGDAMQEAMKDGQFELDKADDGFVTNTDRFVNRDEAYKLAVDSGQLNPDDYAKRGAFSTKKLESTIFQESRQFQPSAELKDDAQWEKIKEHPSGKFGGGLTGWAFEKGAEAKTPEALADFRSANETFSNLSKEAMKSGNFEKAMDYMSRAQAAHEAYQAATGEKIDGTPASVDFIRKHFDKEYNPPMPGENFKKSQENSSAQGIDKSPNIGDTTSMIQAQPKAAEETPFEKTGPAFKPFFSSVTQGKFGKSEVPFEPELDLSGRHDQQFIEEQDKHTGNFDEHIAKSIPTFKETQVRVGRAIADALPDDSKVLDIAGSEGSLMKTISALSKGGIKTVTLDPNPDMAKFFAEKSQVPGASFERKAFLNGFEDNGEKIPAYDPKDKFDVVHEAMGFQFISPDRKKQIEEAKRLMKPNGVFLAEEKVKTAKWAANEKFKDENHKSKYFSEADLKEKNRKVGFTQSKDETKAVGMTDNMVPDYELEKLLQDSFKHVVQYWDSGNFKGYAAGDNAAEVNRIVERMGDLNSKFSTTQLPRNLSEDQGRDAFAAKLNLAGAFQPSATEDDWKMPDKATSGFKKAWITPDGQPVQLGGQWHHLWLAQHPEYGIKVSDVPTMDDDARVEALKKGFARLNYMQNSGTLVVEARAKDWPKQKDNVRKFVEANAPDLDNISIALTDPKVSDVVDSNRVKLFNFDDGDKSSNVPLLQESSASAHKDLGPVEAETIRPDKSYNPSDSYFKTQAQPKKEDDALPGFETAKALSSQEISGMTKDELKAHFPEAIVPKKRNESIPSDIVGSPLYKEAGNESKAVDLFAKKMVDFAKSWEDHPVFKAGAKWYSEFAPAMKEQFGADAPLMAELLAATSPQTNVETNFAYALDALESIKSGRFDKIIDKFQQGLAMLEDERWLSWYNRELKAGNIPEPPAEPTEAAFLEAWIHKHDLKPRQSNGKLYGQHSLPVLQVFARRWLDLNRGPKTRNFVANLLGDGHEATVDLWADRTMRRLGYADHKERWRILPQNKAGVSDTDFVFAQKVYRKAAEQLGMNPDDLQGALWFAEKQLWSDNGWGKLDLGDFRKEMEKVPMLRKGYEQRLAVTKAKQKAKPEQQIDLMDINPRKVAQ